MAHLTLDKFECNGEAGSLGSRWEKWKRSLYIYLEAANVTTSNQKRASLLHWGGPDLQEIFYKIPTTTYRDEDEGEDVFKASIKKLDNYFAPKQYKRCERYIFRKMKQGCDERFEKFVVRLRQQAEKCQFMDVDDQLIDQIAEKCRSDKLRQKILKSGDELTLDQIIIEANALDVLCRQIKDVNQNENNIEDVNKMRTKSKDIQLDDSRQNGNNVEDIIQIPTRSKERQLGDYSQNGTNIKNVTKPSEKSKQLENIYENEDNTGYENDIDTSLEDKQLDNVKENGRNVDKANETVTRSKYKQLENVNDNGRNIDKANETVPRSKYKKLENFNENGRNVENVPEIATRSKEKQLKIITENEKNIETVSNISMTSKDEKEENISRNGKNTEDVNKVATRSKNKQSIFKKRCFECSGCNHLEFDEKCTSKEIKCSKCGSLGHFRTECKTKVLKRKFDSIAGKYSFLEKRCDFSKRLKKLENQIRKGGKHKEFTKDDEKVNYVFNVGKDETVKCVVGGIELEMLIDSGCKCNPVTDDSSVDMNKRN